MTTKPGRAPQALRALVVAASLIACASAVACAGNELRVTESSRGADAEAAAQSGTGDDGGAATTTAPPPTTTTRPATTTAPPPPPTTASTRPAPPTDQSPEGLSLSFVNRKRAENGLGALRTDPDLQAAAEGWAQELVRRQDLGHNPNLGDEVPDRFHAWGENVAYSSDAGDIDMMWWNSEGHRANILGDSYTSIGIAFTQDSQGVTWAVQVFAG